MLIFLVGFMGCGKSYLGRHLAPLMQYDYIDMDKYIEENEGLSVKEIFEQKGEDYFRKTEHYFLETLDANKNIVISTGGGVPCFFNNMEIINQKGLSIFINPDKEVTISRLIKGKHKRPLLASLSQEEIEDYYDKKLAERLPFYKQAKIQVGKITAEELLPIIENYKT